MRLAPALGTCWLATVAVLVGCSTWTATPKAAQVLSAKAPSSVEMADTASGVSAPVRSRQPAVHVPHIDESSIARSRDSRTADPGSSMSAQIDREIATMRAEWDTRRQDMKTVRPQIPERSKGEPQASALTFKDIRVTAAMVAVERKYAPRYLNCRMRITRLESLLTDAGGAVRDSLLRKLEQAKADLSALDATCAREMEIARLDVAPVIGEKDGEANSSKQNTVSDASAGTDSYPNGKAGGGPD